MNRPQIQMPQIQIEVRDRDFGALVPRRTFSTSMMIVGAVAAVFFALGLTR